MLRVRLAALVGVLLLATPLAAQQSPVPAPAPPATGLIIGTVVDATTRQPIAGATININGRVPRDLQMSQFLTGADGRFLYQHLPAGHYSFQAIRRGYVSGGGQSGSVREDWSIDLVQDEHRTDLQLPLRRTATVTGSVTDEFGDPVVNASVAILARRPTRDRIEWSTGGGYSRTDDRGWFRFSNVNPGEYVVAVEQINASMPPDAIDAFQKQVSGGVASENAIGGLFQEAMSLGMSPQAPGSTGARLVNGQTQTLNSSSLQPKTDASGALSIYPTTFFPAVTTITRATVLTVKSGEERSGVDITLRPVRTAALSGTLMGPSGPVGFTSVVLIPRDGAETPAFVQRAAAGQVSTVSDANGKFTMLAVPAGEYTLKVATIPAARLASSMVMSTVQLADGSTRVTGSGSEPTGLPPPLPPDPSLFAQMPISVGAKDQTNVIVTLRAGGRLSGRVLFDGTAKPPTSEQLERMQVTLSPDPPSTLTRPQTRIDAQGAITSQGIPGGRYYLSATNVPGWFLKSVTTAGVDASQRPIDIGVADISDVVVTFVDRVTRLTGKVSTGTATGTGAAASTRVDATVIAFPSDESLDDGHGFNTRRIVTARASASGVYTFSNIPSGAYHVIAISDITVSERPLTAEFLKSLSPRSTNVTIVNGETRSQDLSVTGIK